MPPSGCSRRLTSRRSSSRRLHLVLSGPDLHGLALVLVRRKDPPGPILHSPEDLLEGLGRAGPGTGSGQGARRVVSGFHEDVADLDRQCRAPVDGGVSRTHRPRSPIGSPSPASKSSLSMAVGSKCRGRSPTSHSSLPSRLRSGGVARARTAQARLRRDPAERSRAKKANSPQIWLTVIWRVGTGLPWDWQTGPSDSSEQERLGR